MSKVARRRQAIALLIYIVALFLAIFEIVGKGVQTDVVTRNVEAANLWAFLQARTVRQTTGWIAEACTAIETQQRA